MIPHKFGSKITEYDLIDNNRKLEEKFELLDALESAVKMGSNLNKNSNTRYKALGAEIELLTDKDEIQRIKKHVYETKAPNHRGLNVWNIKVKNIFKVKLPDERRKFETKGKLLGNVRELFHGSRNCNVLSILKNGLKIFRNHPTKAGDMFGPGLYFADNSTKSANYCTGFWNSSKLSKKYHNHYMFLADVAMGKMLKETRATMKRPSRNYDSVKGCRGSNLYNNEYVIYTEEQATLKYIIEFSF